MPSLAEELASDFAAAIEAYEQTFEHAGNLYNIVRSNQPTDTEQQDGGWGPGIGSANKPGIDFAFCIAVAYESGVRGLRTTAGIFVPGFPAIGDLCNGGQNQIKNLGGDADPTGVTLTVFAGSPDR